METKRIDIPFELKEVSDEGTFVGFASVYGVLDLGGDVVDKGAFARTINARPEVPVLWRHDSPIGIGRLEDSEKGLVIRGKLTMAVAQAKEALALMKDGVVKGLSIGFSAVKDDVKEGIRHLKEVKLWEVSVVPFPMCPEAQISAVKKAPIEETPMHEEFKEGRMMSAATRAQIESAMADHRAAMDKLQALLDDAGKASPGPAEKKSDDPVEDHSACITLIDSMRQFLSGQTS